MNPQGAEPAWKAARRRKPFWIETSFFLRSSKSATMILLATVGALGESVFSVASILGEQSSAGPGTDLKSEGAFAGVGFDSSVLC